MHSRPPEAGRATAIRAQAAHAAPGPADGAQGRTPDDHRLAPRRRTSRRGRTSGLAVIRKSARYAAPSRRSPTRSAERSCTRSPTTSASTTTGSPNSAGKPPPGTQMSSPAPRSLTCRLASGRRKCQTQGVYRKCPQSRRPKMRSATYDLTTSTARADALFASALQRSDQPTAAQVHGAIAAALAAFGIRGCAARVAQAYGDHPETAVQRMRWARATVTRAAVTRASDGVRAGRRAYPVSAGRAFPAPPEQARIQRAGQGCQRLRLCPATLVRPTPGVQPVSSCPVVAVRPAVRAEPLSRLRTLDHARKSQATTARRSWRVVLGAQSLENHVEAAEAHQVAGANRDLAADPPSVHPGAVGGLQVGEQPAVRVRSSRACSRETVMSAIARSQPRPCRC